MIAETANPEDLKANLMDTVETLKCAHCGRRTVAPTCAEAHAACQCGETYWLCSQVFLPWPVERIVLNFTLLMEAMEADADE